MPTFYRVHSRTPLNRPSMTIGAAVPSAGGYIDTFTELTRSRAKAEREQKQLKKAKPFGRHELQEFEIDANMAVATDKGTVVTAAPPTSKT